MNIYHDTLGKLVRLTEVDTKKILPYLKRLGYYLTKKDGGKIFTPDGKKCIAGYAGSGGRGEEKGRFWFFEGDYLLEILPLIMNELDDLKTALKVFK